MAAPYSGGQSIPVYDAPEGAAAPATWTWPSLPNVNLQQAGPAIAAGGYGLEAFAQLAQGIQAQKRAKAIATYNAKVAETNAQAQAQAAELEAQQHIRQAQIAQQDQVVAQEADAYRTQRLQEHNDQILGQTRAIVGSSGLMMTGSPLLVYEETVRQQTFDVLAQHYQTALQVRASAEQGTEAEYAAALSRYGAGERLRVGATQAGLIRGEADTSQVAAGLMQAGGSLVRGASTYGYLSERQKAKSLLSEG